MRRICILLAVKTAIDCFPTRSGRSKTGSRLGGRRKDQITRLRVSSYLFDYKQINYDFTLSSPAEPVEDAAGRTAIGPLIGSAATIDTRRTATRALSNVPDPSSFLLFQPRGAQRIGDRDRRGTPRQSCELVVSSNFLFLLTGRLPERFCAGYGQILPQVIDFEWRARRDSNSRPPDS
jgi:hypothetical protein